MRQTPLLFISDSPSLPTGLARITKDLACLAAELPQFRIGVMGRGGHGSSKLPFAQFNFDERDQWGEEHLEHVWDDFAGQEHGVIMTIWDVSRLGWFARPQMGGRLQRFLESKRFEKWAYVPVDSYGVGGRLTGACRDTLLRFDRVLAYTIFGKQIIEATTGRETDWIPHGFNADVFKPRDKAAGRMAMGVKAGVPVIGAVMTNQARKDWGTAFGTIAYLKNEVPDLVFWAHVDVALRHWNMLALIDDFGLHDSVRLTFSDGFSSEELSFLYSACDVTVLPSLGEGFGFPIVESMACGVPCVVGNYGGGAELVHDERLLVSANVTRLDTMWNVVRPVWNPVEWARTVKAVLDVRRDGEQFEVERAVEHLSWKKLWPGAWKRWFLEGVKA